MTQSATITRAFIGALLLASFALGFDHARTTAPTCQPRPIPTHTS
jgi:hypothetical protein